MHLLGWTPEQFGNAKLYYERITGDAPPPTILGARKVSEFWRSRRADAPLETKLADVEQEIDWDWAVESFASTAMTYPG